MAARASRPAARRAPNSAPRQRNTQTAAELSELFHGRPVEQIESYVDQLLERVEFCKLGDLIELRFRPPGREELYLDFTRKGIDACSAPTGEQIYFLRGDQKLNLAGLQLDRKKDYLILGPCTRIEYYTSKDFHNFEPKIYWHPFGEVTGERPMLCYDNLNGLLFLVGGAYHVRREGITN